MVNHTRGSFPTMWATGVVHSSRQSVPSFNGRVGERNWRLGLSTCSFAHGFAFGDRSFILRRERDSNSRDPFGPTAFQVRRTRPTMRSLPANSLIPFRIVFFIMTVWTNKFKVLHRVVVSVPIFMMCSKNLFFVISTALTSRPPEQK